MYVYVHAKALTDIIRSISCEVSEEANEKGLPETVASSSSAPEIFSKMVPEGLTASSVTALALRVLETWTEEVLHERDRNSMSSIGVSGGRN